MQFHEKITYYRKKAMLSQEALAEKVGVSRQAVSKWETGESQPELNKMAALAQALNVSVDWMLSTDDPVEESQPMTEAVQSRQYPDWMERFPGFLKKLFYRYGWLMGVYMAVAGALFTGIGALAKYAVSAMTSGFLKGTQSMMDGFQDSVSSMGGYPSVGGDPFSGITSGFAGAVNSMMEFNPVSMIGNVMIVFGIILVIGGVIMAVALKKYGQNQA
jgi:transcriptional regulator with XRE-family HTH domain